MPGIRQRAGPVGLNAQHETGGEASLCAAHEPLIEVTQNFGWLFGVLGKRPQRAHNEGDGHGGLESFAAHIAQDDQRARIFLRGCQWNDLEEVAADLCGRLIDAGNGEARDGRCFLRNEDVLRLARRPHFKLDLRLAAALQELLEGDGVEQYEEEQRVQQETSTEGVVTQVQAPGLEWVDDRPMGKAITLTEYADQECPQPVKEGRDTDGQHLCLPFAEESDADDEKDVERCQRVDSGRDGVDPLGAQPGGLPTCESDHVDDLGEDVKDAQGNGPSPPLRDFVKTEKSEEQQPDRYVARGIDELQIDLVRKEAHPVADAIQIVDGANGRAPEFAYDVRGSIPLVKEGDIVSTADCSFD